MKQTCCFILLHSSNMALTTGSTWLSDTFSGDYGPEESTQPDQSTDYPLVFLYTLVFVVSLCANCMVLVTIHLFEKLTTVTNLLLLNLVLSSLLSTINLPFLAVYAARSHWPFGDLMCKLVASLYYLGFHSSVLLLTVLTFDRHLAVVYSLRTHRLRSRLCALVSCAAVWTVSALACIKPMMLQKTVKDNMMGITYCRETMREIPQVLLYLGFYTQLILFFLLPLLIIIYCYTRITYTVLSSQLNTKFKTVRLIFVIVLLFFICWTPFNVAFLMYEMASQEEREKCGRVLAVTQKFTYLYFCISPIFYTFVGKKFQNYFRTILVTRFPRLKKHISVSQVSSSHKLHF